MSNVQLYLGDCLEVMKTIAAGSIDAVITDPPYGINFKYQNYNDDSGQYEQMMQVFVAEASRIVGDGPVFVWQAMINADKWHHWFPPGFRIFAACKSFVQYRPTAVQYSWDPVIWWGKPKTKPSVYSKDYHEQRKAPFGKNRERIEHPCPRPLEQVEYIVKLVTLEGGTVGDFFMGSGTTGVACVHTGRNFIGVEISENYFHVAEKRIKDAQSQLIMSLEIPG